MAFYRDRILPHLLHAAMSQERFEPYRARLLSGTHGRVLEIGIGSGGNLPFYANDARVIGLDPSRPLLSLAQRATRHPAQVTLLEGSADRLPLRDAAVDTVVVAWTLCSIPDVMMALREMRRVLRPEGRLLFVEHGRAPEAGIARWQDRLTPLWKRVAGGCHLNRPVDHMLREAGFRIERLKKGYMQGPRLITYMYEGEAWLTPPSSTPAASARI